MMLSCYRFDATIHVPLAGMRAGRQRFFQALFYAMAGIAATR